MNRRKKPRHESSVGEGENSRHESSEDERKDQEKTLKVQKEKARHES